MNKLATLNMHFFKPSFYIKQSEFRIGTQFIAKCRFFDIIHKTSKKYFKFVNYDLKMEVIDTKYNGKEYNFMLFKIIDFCPYEYHNNFYINSVGKRINYEPFIYGSTIAGFPDDFAHEIICNKKILSIKKPFVLMNNNKFDNPEKIDIVMQIKKGIKTSIVDFYSTYQEIPQSPSKKRLNEDKILSESPSAQNLEVIVKRRKSIDENDDSMNIEEKNNDFIDNFIEKSRLSSPKNIKVEEKKKKVDAKELYKNLLKKYGHS